MPRGFQYYLPMGEVGIAFVLQFRVGQNIKFLFRAQGQNETGEISRGDSRIREILYLFRAKLQINPKL